MDMRLHPEPKKLNVHPGIPSATSSTKSGQVVGAFGERDKKGGLLLFFSQVGIGIARCHDRPPESMISPLSNYMPLYIRETLPTSERRIEGASQLGSDPEVTNAAVGARGASPRPISAPQEGSASGDREQGLFERPDRSPEQTSESNRGNAGEEDLTKQEQEELRRLKDRDTEVRRHEEAHAAAGGAYAGSPNYEYERGTGRTSVRGRGSRKDRRKRSTGRPGSYGAKNAAGAARGHGSGGAVGPGPQGRRASRSQGGRSTTRAAGVSTRRGFRRSFVRRTGRRRSRCSVRGSCLGRTGLRHDGRPNRRAIHLVRRIDRSDKAHRVRPPAPECNPPR